MRAWSFGLALAALFALPGCGEQGCIRHSDCLAPTMCIVGRCILADDAAVDGSVDGSVALDAGPDGSVATDGGDAAMSMDGGDGAVSMDAGAVDAGDVDGATSMEAGAPDAGDAGP